MQWRTIVAGLAIAGLVTAMWVSPAPDGLAVQAWRLFAIFFAVSLTIIANVVPILPASMVAIALAILTGTVEPAAAYSGFSDPTILLIVLAFLVARAVVKCGLGARVGHSLVTVFGRSTLGLSYSIVLVDAVIAPAFPSNTARSGVLYPLTQSLADAVGATVDNPERRRVGAYLMFSGMASLSLSSALWLTAMAANPLGTQMAAGSGVTIGFGTWLLASSVPTLLAMALLPLVLYRVMAPEVTATPGAPASARRALHALGPLSRDERIVAATCVAMVVVWALASSLDLDSTAVAFVGLAILVVSGTLTAQDIAAEGDVLATYIWFASLFAISTQLDQLGFMAFLGERLAFRLGDLPAAVAGVALVITYVALHYLFVSQTAHLLALFAVFLDVGIRLGVPAAPLACQLLFATNYFSVIAPHGSSANLLFAGSGYLSTGDLYKLGGLTTAFNVAVYLIAGTPWLRLVLR
jgi:DASS family divalent anion:Na+ symporter